MNAREAAYQAILYAIKKKGFIAEYLEKWIKQYAPSSKDTSLAKEIAYGTMRRQLSLNYIAKKLSPNLNLKTKEETLLHTALYQLYFMDRLPTYAIVNETINIAKKTFHHKKAAFLNFLLRKDKIIELPSNDTNDSLSIQYSYPKFFVEQLLKQYGINQAKKIMLSMNSTAPTTARIRSQNKMEFIKATNIPKIIASSDHYIQNQTPVALINELCKQTPPPKNILDLCAAPGGKTILVHDKFPDAKLHANDISEKKLTLLKENFQKYNLSVQLSLSPGETFSAKEKFDLIIIDAPCSNSGVLNKRPEARWRISKESLNKLTTTQKNLIQNAKNLLSPTGEIWYMTCSILSQENENLIKTACNNQLVIKNSIKILPSNDGWDGGFATALIPKM